MGFGSRAAAGITKHTMVPRTTRTRSHDAILLPCFLLCAFKPLMHAGWVHETKHLITSCIPTPSRWKLTGILYQKSMSTVKSRTLDINKFDELYANKIWRIEYAITIKQVSSRLVDCTQFSPAIPIQISCCIQIEKYHLQLSNIFDSSIIINGLFGYVWYWRICVKIIWLIERAIPQRRSPISWPSDHVTLYIIVGYNISCVTFTLGHTNCP